MSKNTNDNDDLLKIKSFRVENIPNNTNNSNKIEKLVSAIDHKQSSYKLKEAVHKIDQLLNEDSIVAGSSRHNKSSFSYGQNLNDLHKQLEHKQDLKRKLNDQFENIERLLDDYKQTCYAHLATSEYLLNQIIKSKQIEEEAKQTRIELNKCMNAINNVEITHEPVCKNNNIVEVKTIKTNIEITNAEGNLLGNDEDKILKVSSLLNESTMNLESLIVANVDEGALKKKLMDLCRFRCDSEWNLLYRGSRDGFKAVDFHLKCDNRPRTLTLIKAKSGNIFGGYTVAEWTTRIRHSHNQWKTDKNAFLFSLVNRWKRPARIDVGAGKEGKAIYCSTAYGPTFGGGHDIQITDNANVNASRSNLGFTYVLPNYTYDTDAARCYLAGSYTFLVAEIEVFQIVHYDDDDGKS